MIHQNLEEALKAGLDKINQDIPNGLKENREWWLTTRIYPYIIRYHPWETSRLCEFFGVIIDQFQEWNWKQHCKKVGG